MFDDTNSLFPSNVNQNNGAPDSLAFARANALASGKPSAPSFELAHTPNFVNYADNPFTTTTPVPSFIKSSDLFTLDTDPFGERTQNWASKTGLPVDNEYVAGLSVFGRAMSREQLMASDAGRRLLELEEKKRKGIKRDFFEAVTDFQWSDLPFLSLFASVGKSVSDAVTVSDTFKKLQNGEAVTDDELIKTRLYMAEQEYTSNGTWGSTVGDIMRAAPGFMTEFLASGGLYSGARLAASKLAKGGIHLGMTRATKVAARELMEAAARQKVGAASVKQAVKDAVVTGADDIAKKPAAEIASRIASLAGDASTEAKDELIEQTARALVNKTNGLMYNNPLYKGLSDDALYQMAHNRAKYEFDQLIARNTGGAVARSLHRSAQWAKNHVSRGLMDFGTWGTDEATVAFTNHSSAGRALFDAIGALTIDAPIKGSLISLPNMLVAKPLIGHLFNEDGRSVSSSQLALQSAAYQTGNKELMERAEDIAMGINLLEYVSENAGRGFSSFARAAGLGLQKAGVKGLVAPASRVILDSGDLLPVDQSAVTIGGKMREYITKVFGSREDYLKRVRGDELRAVTRAFNITDTRESAKLASALAHRDFSTLTPELAAKLGVDLNGGSKGFDAFIKDVMTKAYDKETTDMAYKSYARFALANYMTKHQIGPESIMNLYQKMGYDGILGEMFEERYSDVAKGLLGLDDRKHHDFMSNLKEAVKGLYPGFDQLTAEAVGFAMPLVTRGAIMKLQSSIGGGGKLQELRMNLEAMDDALRLPLAERMEFGNYMRSYLSNIEDLQARIKARTEEHAKEKESGNDEAMRGTQREIEAMNLELNRRRQRHKDFSATVLDVPTKLAAIEKEIETVREKIETARSTGSASTESHNAGILRGLEQEAQELRITANQQNIDISNLGQANAEAMIGVPILTTDQYRASEEQYNLFTLPTSDEVNQVLDAQDSLSNYSVELAPMLWKASHPQGGGKWARYIAGKTAGLAGAIVTGDFSLVASSPEQWVARDMGVSKQMCDTLVQEFDEQWNRIRKSSMLDRPNLTYDEVTEEATKAFAPRARAITRAHLLASQVRSFSRSHMLDQALMYLAKSDAFGYQVDLENRRFVKFADNGFDVRDAVSFDKFYEDNKKTVDRIRDDIAVATFDILTSRMSVSTDARQSLVTAVNLPANSEILAPAVYDLAMRMVSNGDNIVRVQTVGQRPIEDDLEGSGLGVVNHDLISYVVNTLESGQTPDDIAYSSLAHSLNLPYDGTEAGLERRNAKINDICRLVAFSHGPDRFFFSREIPIDANDIDRFQRSNKVRIEVVRKGDKYVTVKGVDEHGVPVMLEHDSLDDFAQDGYIRETPRTILTQKQVIESDDMYLMLRQLNHLDAYQAAFKDVPNEAKHPMLREYSEEELEKFVEEFPQYEGLSMDELHEAIAGHTLRYEMGLAQYATAVDGEPVVNEVPKGVTPQMVTDMWNRLYKSGTGYITVGEQILRRYGVSDSNFLNQATGYRVGEYTPRNKYRFVLSAGSRTLVSARTFVPVDVNKSEDFVAAMTNQILLDSYARNSTLLSNAMRGSLSNFLNDLSATIQLQIDNPNTPDDVKADLIQLLPLTLMADRTAIGEDGKPKTTPGVGMTADTFVTFASGFALFQDVRRGLAGLQSAVYGKALAHIAPYVRQLSTFPEFMNIVDLVLGGNGMFAEFIRDQKAPRQTAPRGIVKLMGIIMKDEEAFHNALKQSLPGGMTPLRFLERCVDTAVQMAKNPIAAVKPKELQDSTKKELRDLASLGVETPSKYTVFFARLADAFGLTDEAKMATFIDEVIETSTEAEGGEAKRSKALAYKIRRKQEKINNLAVKLIYAVRERDALGAKIKELMAGKPKGSKFSQINKNTISKLKVLREQQAEVKEVIKQAEEELARQRETPVSLDEKNPGPTDVNAAINAGISDISKEDAQKYVVNTETPADQSDADNVYLDYGADEENFSVRPEATDVDRDLSEVFAEVVLNRNESENHVMTEESARLGVNIVVRASMAAVSAGAGTPREISEQDFLDTLDKMFPLLIGTPDRALMLDEFRKAESFVVKHGGSWAKYGTNGSKWVFTEDDKDDESTSDNSFNKSAVDEYNSDELGMFLDYAVRVSPETGRNIQAFFTNIRELTRDGVSLTDNGIYGKEVREAFEFLNKLLNPRASLQGETYNERKAVYDQFVMSELNDTDKVNKVIATLLGKDGAPVLRRGALLLSYLASLKSSVRMRFLDLVSESTVSDMVHMVFNDAGQLTAEKFIKTDIMVSVDMLRSAATAFVGKTKEELNVLRTRLQDTVQKFKSGVDSKTANIKRKTRTDRTGATDILAVYDRSKKRLDDANRTVISNAVVLADVIGEVFGRENPLYSALSSPMLHRYIMSRATEAQADPKASFARVLSYLAEEISPEVVNGKVRIRMIDSLASVLETLPEMFKGSVATLEDIEPLLIAMFSTGNLVKAGAVQAPSGPEFTDPWNTLLGMYEDSQPITVRRAELDQQRDRGAASSVAVAAPGIVPLITRFMDHGFEDFIKNSIPEDRRNLWDELTPEVLANCRQDVRWPDRMHTPLIAKNISKSYDAVEVLNACAVAAVGPGKQGPVWIPVYAGDKNSAVMLQIPHDLVTGLEETPEGSTALDVFIPFAQHICDLIGLDLLGTDTKRVALSSMSAAGTSTVGVKQPATDTEKPVFGEHRVHIAYNFDMKKNCAKNNEAMFGNTVVVGYAADRQRERAKIHGTGTLKCHAVSTQGDYLAFLKALVISPTESRGDFPEGTMMRVYTDYLRNEIGNNGSHSTHTLTDKDSYKIGIAGSKTIRVITRDAEGGEVDAGSLMDFVFKMLEKLSDEGKIKLDALNMTTEDLDGLIGEVEVKNTLTGKIETKPLSEFLPKMRLKTVKGTKTPVVDLSYVDNNISYYSVANVSHDATTEVTRTPRNHIIDAYTMAVAQSKMSGIANHDASDRVLELISHWGLIANTLNSHPSVLQEIYRKSTAIAANTQNGEHPGGQNNLEELAKNLQTQVRKTNNLPLYSINAPLVSACAEIGNDGTVYYQTDSLMQRAMMVGSWSFTADERKFYRTKRRLALCNVNVRHASFRYGWFLDREKFVGTYGLAASASDKDILLKLEEEFTRIRNQTEAARRLKGKERKESRDNVIQLRQALMGCFRDHHNQVVGERKLPNGKSYAETVCFEDLFIQNETSGGERRFDRSAVQIDEDQVHNDASGKSHIFLAGTTFGFPRTPSYNGSMWLQTVRAGLPVTEIEHKPVDEEGAEGAKREPAYEVGKDAMVSADPFTNKILGCDHDGDKTKLYMYFSQGGDVDFVDQAYFEPFANMNEDAFVGNAEARMEYFNACLNARGVSGAPMFVKKYRDADGKVAIIAPGESDHPGSWYELSERFRYMASNSFVQSLFDMSRDLECKPDSDVRQLFADGPMSRETKANPLDSDEELNEILNEVGAPNVITKKAMLDNPLTAAMVSKMAMDASDARAKVVSVASSLHVAWASNYFFRNVRTVGKRVHSVPGLFSGLEHTPDWIKFIYLVDGISNATFDDLKNQKCSRLGWTASMMEVLMTDIILNRGAGKPVTSSQEMYDVLRDYAKDINKDRGSRYWMKNMLDDTNVSFQRNIRRIFGAIGPDAAYDPRDFNPEVNAEHIKKLFGIEEVAKELPDGRTVTEIKREPPARLGRANLGQAVAYAFETAAQELHKDLGLFGEDGLKVLLSCSSGSGPSKTRLGYLGWLVKEVSGSTNNAKVIIEALRTKKFDLGDSKVMEPIVDLAKKFITWNTKFSQLNEAVEFTRAVNYAKTDPGNDNVISTRDRISETFTKVIDSLPGVTGTSETDAMLLHLHRMHIATRASYNLGYNVSTLMARALTDRNRATEKNGAAAALTENKEKDQDVVKPFLSALDNLDFDTRRFLPVWDKLSLQANAQQIPYILAVLQTRDPDSKFYGAVNAFDKCNEIATKVGEARRRLYTGKNVAGLKTNKFFNLKLKRRGGNAVAGVWGGAENQAMIDAHATDENVSKVLDFRYGIESAFDLMYRLVSTSMESYVNNAFSYFRMVEDTSYAGKYGKSGGELSHISLQFRGGTENFIQRARNQVDAVKNGLAFAGPRELHRFSGTKEGGTIAKSYSLTSENIDHLIEEALNQVEARISDADVKRDRRKKTVIERVVAAGDSDLTKLYKRGETVKAFLDAVGGEITPKMMFSDLLPIYSAINDRTLGAPDPRSRSLFTVLGGYEAISEQQVTNDTLNKDVIDCMIPYNFAPTTTTLRGGQSGDLEKTGFYKRENPSKYKHCVDIFSPGFPFRSALQLLGTQVRGEDNDTPGKKLGDMLVGNIPVPAKTAHAKVPRVERLAEAMNALLPWASVKYEGGTSFLIHGNLGGDMGKGKRLAIVVNAIDEVETEEEVAKYANSYAYATSLTSAVDLGITAREFLDALPLEVRKALVRKYGVGGATDNRVFWSIDGKSLATVVQLSLPNTDVTKVGSVAYHEYFHAMFAAFDSLGLFSKADFKAFEKAFGKTPEGSQWSFDTEKAAEAFRKWVLKKEDVEAKNVRSVFQKIYDFVKEILSVIMRGFRYEDSGTADTLFTMLISGVAQRSEDAAMEAGETTLDAVNASRKVALRARNFEDVANVANVLAGETVESATVPEPSTDNEALARPYADATEAALTVVKDPAASRDAIRDAVTKLAIAGNEILGVTASNGELPVRETGDVSYGVENVDPLGTEEADVQSTQVAVKLATVPAGSVSQFYKSGELVADAVRNGLAANGSWDTTLDRIHKRYRDAHRALLSGIDERDKQVAKQALRQLFGALNPEAKMPTEKLEENLAFQALLVAEATITQKFVKPDAFAPGARGYLHGGESVGENELKEHASAYDVAGWVLASRSVSPHDLAEQSLDKLRDLRGGVVAGLRVRGEDASSASLTVIDRCIGTLEKVLHETGDRSNLVDWVAWKGSTTVNEILPELIGGLKKPAIDGDGFLQDYVLIDDPTTTENQFSQRNFELYSQCITDRPVQEALKTTITTVLQALSMNKFYRETGVFPGTIEDLDACRTFNALNIPNHKPVAEWFHEQCIGNVAASDAQGLIEYQNQSGFIGTNVDNWIASQIRPSFGNVALRDMMMSETHEYEWLKSVITHIENNQARLLGDDSDAGAELLAVRDHESEFRMEYGNVRHDPENGRNYGLTYGFDGFHRKGCGIRYTVDELRTVDLYKKSLSAWVNRQTYMLTGVNRITFNSAIENPGRHTDPKFYEPKALLDRWSNAAPGTQFTRMEIACVRMLRQLHKEVLNNPVGENSWYLGIYDRFVNTACASMRSRFAAIDALKDGAGNHTSDSLELARSFNSDVLQDLEAAGLVLAQRNDDNSLKQGTLVLNVRSVHGMFRNSSAYKKLTSEKGGRKPEWLTPSALTKELMEVYRKATEFAKRHAWISNGDAKYLNTFGTPLMFFSGSGVFMYDANRVARDVKRARSNSAPRYIEAYQRLLASDQADVELGLRHLPALEIVTDIFRLREEGDELLERIHAGDYRPGSDKALKTGFAVEPGATNADIAEIVYQRLLDLAWQEQVSDGKLKFNVRSMEDMIELYEKERGAAQNFATGGLGMTDETIFKRYGILPANMQLGHKVHIAIDQITNALMQRNTLVNMLFTPAADGAPVYIANPSEYVRDENGQSIPEGVWSELARWWADFYGDENPELRGKIAYDESRNGIENAKRIYGVLSEMAKTNKGKLTYKIQDGSGDHRYSFLPEEESDIVSVNGWLVMDDEDLGEESSLLNKISGGEAMGYLRQVVQSGRVLGMGGAGVRKHLQRALSWSKSLSVSFSMFFPLATRFESPVGAVGAMATMMGNTKAGSKFLRKHPELMSKLQGMFVGKGWITKDFLGFSDVLDMMDTHDPFLAEMYTWASALGITISDRLVNPMEPTKSRVVEDIKRMKQIVKDSFDTKTAAKFGNMMGSLFIRSGEKSFTYVLNATKLCVVAQLAMKLRHEAQKRGKAFDPVRDLRKYSGYINAEVGGIDPAAYAWATPRFRSMMNSLLFSWEWTRGAWEAGGGHFIEDLIFGGHSISKEERRLMLGRWARMWGEVMIGVPVMMQIACKALGLALGHDDDDDEWLAWNNENKVGAAAFDITPLLRGLEKFDETHLGGAVRRIKESGGPLASLVGGATGLVAGATGSGRLGSVLTGGIGATLGAGLGSLATSLVPMYTGGDPANQTTMHRRYYMHFGKQGWEFFRWFEAPGQQFMTKLSMPVQRMLEGFFGRNLSYLEKELPWSDMGPLERWMPVPDSATLNYFKAFLPFSVNGLSQFGDAGFLPIFGPVSMGASQTAIQDKLVKAVTMWANNDRRGYSAGMQRKSKTAKYNTGMVADILRDAELNGLDAKDMYDKALGQVMTRVYSRLFRALPADPSKDFDVKEVERCARILNRLGAKKKSVVQSIKKRLERQGRDWGTVLTPEQRDMYMRVIGTALKHPFDFGEAIFGIDY